MNGNQTMHTTIESKSSLKHNVIQTLRKANKELTRSRQIGRLLKLTELPKEQLAMAAQRLSNKDRKEMDQAVHDLTATLAQLTAAINGD